MANSSITKRGLLLYYSSLDEILKIDSAELGDLIKKEMEWMSGRNDDEPVFNDVRCDVFHMHLKEQIMVREIEKEKHKPKDNEEQDDNISTNLPKEEDNEIQPYDFKSFDECVEILKGIKDKSQMVAEANRMERKYKHETRDLCHAVIGR